MPPKPFPFPLGVGVDIIDVSRLYPLLRDHDAMNRWTQRIFNRLEWPDLLKVFQSQAVHVKDTVNDPVNDTSANESQSQLMLPKVPKENLRATKNIVKYLAGRWAVKEAAIKAHTYRHRQLSMNEVSVLRWGPKFKILIDPPCATIAMDALVASRRGLRNARLSRTAGIEPSTSERPIGDLSDCESVGSGSIYRRRALIKEEDRQVAEGSISHDGHFAIATCMALNERGELIDEKCKDIVDDGSGDPVHEPTWGDEGFLETESVEDLDEAASYLKRRENRSVLFSEAKTPKS